ncbi:glycoside hydrolase family 43 protein [Demequina sp. SYSU T00039]|uniref:Glycoside hydrolase family 43 protein n=1 Tax=Demequina lignilytica TaxID=3051663 RepID=A0AAW7M7J9_9MICO|nr:MULTISPECIES: glycoside hydrolase family 43 protein [unclassified Demequina]MDN4478393.1 glycoside hydrolase family 43 protein [Demequina sp. SYSU T00039-1]MDN4487100.1 glycoside hydrolase family 43 protein [Demequina sp. SYSU T00039]MDN4489811.1 glycoside hydrolase family 43 protein [Demequina sp. SYSU T00068]
MSGEEPYGYLMVHFVEDAEGYREKVHLSLSRGDDAEAWDRLNGGEPVLASHLGTTGVRDPHLTFDPATGRYFIIATDLRVFGGDDLGWDAWTHGSSTLMNVWESRDLIVWSPLRQLDVCRGADGAPAPGVPALDMMWAPESTWVPDLLGPGEGGFVVYFSAGVAGGHHRIVWGTTTDFTQETWRYGGILLDTGDHAIDCSMIEHAGRTYRVTKDNGATARGIVMERTEAARWWEADAVWEPVQDRLGEEHARGHGVEGPLMFRAHGRDRWYLYVDVIPDGGYRPLVAADLDAERPWRILDSPGFDLPPATKHGGVIGLTRAQHEALRRADARAAVTPDLGAVAVLPPTVQAHLHGGGTASFPVVWGAAAADGSVEGVLAGTLGANLNAWVGEGGSTAWDAPGKVPLSTTAIRVRATLVGPRA